MKSGDFVVTAEYLPRAETEGSAIKAALQALKEVPSAVNVADNPFGVGMSSLAASVILAQSGIEPVYRLLPVTETVSPSNPICWVLRPWGSGTSFAFRVIIRL